MQAWLGEAIEIKPATTATFERYIRSNLLIVGGEERGHGLLLATLLSAGVQRSPGRVRFTIAEFTRPSSTFHGFFAPLENLPHEVQIAGGRTAGAALDDLIADLDARLTASDGAAAQPERFFLIAGMHRWHELLAEGNYGRPSEISAQLVRLADKGPDAGIHVVAWTDGYATAERALPAGIGFFGLRAVLRVLSPRGERLAARGVPPPAWTTTAPCTGTPMARRTGREVQAVLDRLPVRLRPGSLPQRDMERELEQSMTEQERAIDSALATSPYLSLRRAVRRPSWPTGCSPETRSERASRPRSARICSP